jgi:hypothetical protein
MLEPAILATRRGFTELAALDFGVVVLAIPLQASSKCANIEECREIGDTRIEMEMAANPTIKLANGVRYKKLKPGLGEESLQNDGTVDIIYSITSQGAYMYSLGFGFEKDAQGFSKTYSTASYRVRLGFHDVPVGIEQVLVGMKRGERRRVELPPAVGFGTSDWKPEPDTRRGKATITAYKQLIIGGGSTRPPFPAETIWDVEVVRFVKPKSQ